MDKFHKHEVVDRTCTIQLMLGELLEDHPGMTPELTALMEKAQAALGELYQRAGEQCESFEQPLVKLSDDRTAKVVNTLRDIAIQFHGAQQLRSRIADVVVPLICMGSEATTGDQVQVGFERWAEDYGLRYDPNYNAGTRSDCLAAYLAGIEFARRTV